MDKISSIVTAPGAALIDGNLSDSEFRLLTLIHSRSGIGGCDESNASLGGMIGATPAAVRMRIEALLQAGWVMEVETGRKRTLKVCTERMATVEVKPPDLGRELFDPKNAKVSDKEVNHLIAQFLKYRINENVCRNAELMSMFYSNPFNRDGAVKLVREFGTVRVKDVMARYAERMDERFCPRLKSLADLYKKWDGVNAYLDKPEDKSITIVD